jgi:hypothetical protein
MRKHMPIQLFYRSDKGNQIEINREEFRELLRGASFYWETWEEKKETIGTKEIIKSPDTIIGKSGNGVTVAFHARSELTGVVTDYGDETDLPISLIDEKEETSAFNIEQKIRALRQLYAIVVLVKSGRGGEVLKVEKGADLERKLLKDDERLKLSSIGVGSLFVTLRSFARNGAEAVVYLVTMLSSSNRQQMQRELRARARSAEIDTERKEFDLEMHKKREKLKFGKLRWNEYKKFVKELNNLTPAERDAVLEPYRRSMSELNVEIEEQKDEPVEGEE